MEAKFFKTPADFRKWLQKNHLTQKELVVGFYKKSTGKKSITWPESVDVALCFGWIDGIRKSIDDESYSNRFTPRKKRSNWSNINIKRIGELMAEGLVSEHGRKVFEERDPTKSNSASFEQAEIKFPAEFEKKFMANKKAWAFFQKQNNSYKKPATWWVIKPKQEKTRIVHLDTLIKDSANGVFIKPLRYGSAPKQ